MTKTSLALTHHQAEILLDRPEDCIIQCMGEAVDGGELPPMDEVKIAEVVLEVMHKVIHWTNPIDVPALSAAERYALEDMLAGSTWCGQIAHLSDSPLSSDRRKLRNAQKALFAIAEKFKEVGLNGSFVPDF